MSEEWGWYAGRHEEEMTAGPEATREAIIQVGRGDFCGESFHIIEARKRPIEVADHANIADLVDRMSETIDDDHADPDGDGAIFDPTPAELHSLEGMLKAEIRRWQELHGILVTPWAFTEMRHEEFIPGELDDDEDADE